MQDDIRNENGEVENAGEASSFTLDSILREYDEAAKAEKAKAEGAEKSAAEQLNDIFEKNAVEKDTAWLDELTAPGADAPASADDGEAQETASEEVLAPEEPQEATDENAVTRVFDKASPEKAQANAVGFEIFENDEDTETEEAVYETEQLPEEAQGASKDPVNEKLKKLFESGSADAAGADAAADADAADDSDMKIAPKPSEKKKSAPVPAPEEAPAEIDMADKGEVKTACTRFATKKKISLFVLFGTAFLLLLTLYAELAPLVGVLPHPAWMSARNPVVYALVDLQLLCFAVMLSLDSLAKGFAALRDKKRMLPAGCAFCIAAVCGVQAILTAILARGATAPRLFCSIGILALFMLAVYDHLKISADQRALRIASSESVKFGAFPLPTDSPECAPFASLIDKTRAKAIAVQKGQIYEGFVERSERRPASEKKLGLLCGILAIVALIVTVFLSIATKSVYFGITSGVIVFITSLPINLFFVSALPKYLAAKNGFAKDAALIGQNASEEYKDLAVIAFQDTEVFLPKDVRISSIKTYNGMPLDAAVILMAQIYGKVGGPLSKIFSVMVDSSVVNEVPVTLTKVCADALCVRVGEKDVCLATASYLEANRMRVVTDSVDFAYTSSDGRVLYLLTGGRVMAKFYIKYAINPAFEKTLSELHDANLCVGIRTLDPCINDDLVFNNLNRANYALSVIKGESEKDIPTVKPRVSSGILSLRSVHGFLEMLLLCERAGRNVKINNIIKYVAFAVSLLLSVAFVLTNDAINLVFCLILQLFWLIPVTVISYFNK